MSLALGTRSRPPQSRKSPSFKRGFWDAKVVRSEIATESGSRTVDPGGCTAALTCLVVQQLAIGRASGLSVTSL
jgi:hypothetical protein